MRDLPSSLLLILSFKNAEQKNTGQFMICLQERTEREQASESGNWEVRILMQHSKQLMKSYPQFFENPTCYLGNIL